MDGLNKEPSTQPALSIFDGMTVLMDPIRCRLLLVLEGHELAVTELCAVLQLPQSTISRHLKVLADDGWVFARREGTSRRYTFSGGDLDAPGQRLWALVREQLEPSVEAAEDRRRLDMVLAERRTRSQEFFSSAAGRWEQLRTEMFGDRFDLQALPALLDPRWIVGDLGTGTGQMAEMLAPFVARVITIDDSETMLEAAQGRLSHLANVEIRRSSLEVLPLAAAELDAALAVLVLHHLAEPPRALLEIARVLRPGGRLLVVDMLQHDREEYRREMGHVWLGFDEAQLTTWLVAAGFEAPRCRPLPVVAGAKGPGLFAAAATRCPPSPKQSS